MSLSDTVKVAGRTDNDELILHAPRDVEDSVLDLLEEETHDIVQS